MSIHADILKSRTYKIDTSHRNSPKPPLISKRYDRNKACVSLEGSNLKYRRASVIDRF